MDTVLCSWDRQDQSQNWRFPFENPLRLSLDRYCHLSRNECCMKLSWCKLEALFKDQMFIFWFYLSFCKTASHNPHPRNKGKHCTTPESKTTIQTQGESFKFILISHNSRNVSHGCESKTKRVSCPTQGARDVVWCHWCSWGRGWSPNMGPNC